MLCVNSLRGFSSLTDFLSLITPLLYHKGRDVLSEVNPILLISAKVFSHFRVYSEETVNDVELKAWLTNSILSTLCNFDSIF